MLGSVRALQEHSFALSNSRDAILILKNAFQHLGPPETQTSRELLCSIFDVIGACYFRHLSLGFGDAIFFIELAMFAVI